MPPFIPLTQTQGVLVNAGDPSEFFEFQYNPTTINESKKINWAEVQIPGADDTLATFGAGASLTLDVELFLNEIMESDRPLANGFIERGYVEDRLTLLHSWTEARRGRFNPGGNPTGKSPAILLFIFGDSQFGAFASTVGQVQLGFPALLVRINALTVQRWMFEPQTNKPRRATARLQLVRHQLFPR